MFANRSEKFLMLCRKTTTNRTDVDNDDGGGGCEDDVDRKTPFFAHVEMFAILTSIRRLVNPNECKHFSHIHTAIKIYFQLWVWNV